jgi:F-type H+-transporting ATPase subunit delta
VEDNRIGRRYAQALFTTAQKYDVVAAVEADLDAIVSALDRDKAFRDFLLAPYSSREEKTAILERLFSDRITALTMQILRVMLEKRREHEIPAVHRDFVDLRRTAQGVILATVTSAIALEESQKKALLAKLQKSLNKTVEAEYKIDPRLIGGIKVTYGTYVIDGSVQGTLNQLKERLRHDLLKQQA